MVGHVYKANNLSCMYHCNVLRVFHVNKGLPNTFLFRVHVDNHNGLVFCTCKNRRRRRIWGSSKQAYKFQDGKTGLSNDHVYYAILPVLSNECIMMYKAFSPNENVPYSLQCYFIFAFASCSKWSGNNNITHFARTSHRKKLCICPSPY